MNPSNSRLNSRLAVWAYRLERINTAIGHGMAWVVIIMTLIVVYDVGMRFIFQSGSVMLQELEWHLFGLIFLLGAAYTFKKDGHVRVEILYQNFSPAIQAKINIFGNIFFLIPLCLLVIWSSWPFIANAYTFSETSPDPGGLCCRWLIKAAIPAGFVLLLLQAVADSIHRWFELIETREDD